MLLSLSASEAEVCVITEVSTFLTITQVSSGQQRLYRAKHLPSHNWTYGDTVAKQAILA